MSRSIFWSALALTFVLTPRAGAADETNPPAPGFDLDGSDPRAIEIADRVMAAMGGRQAWDATRFLRWRFFGRRLHVWDKHSGDIRVEGVDSETDEPYVVLYQMGRNRDGAWKLRNVIIESVNLGEIYRDQFQAAAREEEGNLDNVIANWTAVTVDVES